MLSQLIQSAINAIKSLFAAKPPAPVGACATGKTSLNCLGTAAEQTQLSTYVESIRNAGPQGKAFVESLEQAPTQTQLSIAKSAQDKFGKVIPLKATGGGVTLRPTESLSGHNEVYVDPTHLIDYTATDGSTVKETPAGLLLHEMGHAAQLNAGDAAQTTGGPDAEANVRTLTNPIRQELGMKPER